MFTHISLVSALASFTFSKPFTKTCCFLKPLTPYMPCLMDYSGFGNGSAVKTLAVQHEGLSSNPLLPHKNMGMTKHVCNPVMSTLLEFVGSQPNSRSVR